MNKNIPFHPLANLFPMMEGEEWEKFKKDIEDNGVLDSIMWHEAKIIDGRNRYKAATELGIECCHADLPEGTDPLAYVLSKNLHRRQLTVGQRSMIVNEIAKLPRGGDQKSKDLTKSLKQVAAMVGVSRDAVVKAKKVKKEATPEVVEAVKQGKMSLNAAEKTIKPTAQEIGMARIRRDATPEMIAKVESGAMSMMKALDILGPKPKPDRHITQEEADFAKKEQPTKKLDITPTEKYKQLKRLYDSMAVDHKHLEHEHRRVIDENLCLKRENERLELKCEKLTEENNNLKAELEKMNLK